MSARNGTISPVKPATNPSSADGKLGIRVVLSGLQPQPRAVLARMHALDHPAIAADLGGFDEAVPAARGLVGRD